MARFLLKKFAKNSNRTGQFGSFQAQGGQVGDGTITSDPTVIQSLPAWENGWNDATNNALKLPRIEEMEGVQRVHNEMLYNVWQEGITVWQPNMPVEAYKTIVQFQTGVMKPKLYINTTGVNGEDDPEIDTENWEEMKLGGYKPNLLTFQWADHLLEDIQWLRADTFSWQSGSVYTSVYNHLTSDISGKTLTSETISGITIQYYLANDGHKICPASEESNVASLFTTTGVAWYYIIDTDNTRFKLPRSKYGFVGLRDSVGNYVRESLPNVIGEISNVANGGSTGGNASGAFKVTGAVNNNKTPSSAYGFISTYSFDASDSSSTYQDNAPVQQRATQMYLYFYVGEFTQSAVEQTAGLNAEMFNDKVDLDALNLSTEGKHNVNTLSFPSNRYTDLTLLASGSEYTAPANGWFVFYGLTTSNNTYIGFNNESEIGCISVSWCPAAGNGLGAYIPVKKNNRVILGYGTAVNKLVFRFIYAEGEENV